MVLASQSQARANMLRNAGLEITTVPARVDEAAVKSAMIADDNTPREIADALAEMKAAKIARNREDTLVLGADQVLVFDGRLFDKPNSLDEAREQMLQLRNNTHELHSAAVIFYGGAPVFRHIGRARLTMRNFTTSFLDDYLEREGTSVLQTVGGYRIEGRGAQLFSRVEGDHFTILGLPLLEILDYLRARGNLPA